MGNQHGQYAGVEYSSYNGGGKPVTLPGQSSTQSNLIPLQTEILTLPPNHKPGRVEMYDYSNLKSARDMQRAFDTAAAHMYVKLKSAADKADEAFQRAHASRNAQAAYDKALLNAPAPETTQLPVTETIAAAPAAPTTTTKYIAPKYEYSAKGRPVTLPGVKGRNLDNLPMQTEILVLPPNHTAGPVEMINYSGIPHLGGFDPMAAVSNVAGNNYAYGTLAYKKGYATYV